MVDFQSSNGYLTVSIANDTYMDATESAIVQKLMNSKYVLKVNDSLFTSSGLISGVTISSVVNDVENDTCTVTLSNGIIFILSAIEYLIEDNDLNVTNTNILYTIYNNIFNFNYSIVMNNYSFNSLTKVVTMTSTSDTYDMYFDLTKFISDLISIYMADDITLTTTSEAIIKIITDEIANVNSLRIEYSVITNSLYKLYTTLNTAIL